MKLNLTKKTNIIKLSILVTIFSAFICTHVDSPLEWTDPVSGTYYNFSSLKKDPR